MNRSFLNIQSFIEMLLMGFFVTLFIPLKLRLFEPGIFLSGDFNPYDTFYLYVSDMFFLLALFLIMVQFFFLSRKAEIEVLHEFEMEDWPIMLFFGLLIVSSLVSFFVAGAPPETLLFSWRWVEMLGLYFIISQKILPLEALARIFVWAMLLQSVIAGLQYMHGASLGFSFIGEPSLYIGEPGVATVTMFGRQVLRGYGTFLHPNIFAAYAVFGIFLSLLYKKTKPFFFSIAIVVLIFGTIISFSRMALFALITLFIFSFYSKKFRVSSRGVVISLASIVGISVVGYFSGLSRVVIERFRFTDMSSLQFRYANFVDGVQLFLRHPFGTGLGGSTEAMQAVSSAKYAPWQYQPAHNLFLIVGDELGVIGLILFVVAAIFLFRFLYRYRQKYPIHFAIAISFFLLSLTDHYFFTLYHGQVLLVLFLSSLILVGRESSPSSH